MNQVKLTPNRIKYFTTESLLEGNRRAKSIRANRTLNDREIRQLPEHLRFPVLFSMLHERCRSVEIRCMIAVGPDADHLTRVFLDVPIDFYESLPEAVC